MLSQARQIRFDTPFRDTKLLGKSVDPYPTSSQNEAETVFLVRGSIDTPFEYPDRNSHLLAVLGSEKPRPNVKGKRFLVVGFDRT
jgi:hypothetical protein